MSKNILAQLIILVVLKAWPSDPGVLMTFTRGLKSQKYFYNKTKSNCLFNLIFPCVCSGVSQRGQMCDICLLLSQTVKRFAKIQTMPLLSLNYIV